LTWEWTEALRAGRELHLTLIRNENAYYGCARVWASLCACV
jgi:hypothetical protein